MNPENCPKCEKKLPPPFKSSGRQVCSGCGWSNKPKLSTTASSSKNKKIKSIPSPEILKEKVKSSKLTISLNQQSIELNPIYLCGFLATGLVGIILFVTTTRNMMADKSARQEINQLKNELQQELQSQAKLILDNYIDAEQIYRLMYNDFTDSKNDLKIEVTLDIEKTFMNYNVEIINADKKKFVVIAQSKDKNDGLKSYAKATIYSDNFYVNDNYDFKTISCETNKPSTTINPPISDSSGWSCGSGSVPYE